MDIRGATFNLRVSSSGVLEVLGHLRRGAAGLSRLLAPHPLQVHARRNQLQPLLVTVTDGKLLHADGLNPTSGAAPHAVRAWRRTLFHCQVWEFSNEASISAVLRPKLLNLFPTLLPVHSAFLGAWFESSTEISTMSGVASWPPGRRSPA